MAETIVAPETPACLELAAAMGPAWPVIMKSGTGGGNPYSQLAAHGKGAINAELGGRCRTLTRDFHAVADRLVEGYLNVLRHYKMIEGSPRYADTWSIGHQETVLDESSRDRQGGLR